MKFICIIDNKNKKCYDVAKSLENMGFKKNIVYTSSNNLDKYKVIHINKDKFDKLVNNKSLIQYENNNITYGIKKPFGAKKFVSLIDEDGFKKLKDIYGDQIIGVYIGKCSDNYYISISDTEDTNKIISDILVKVRDLEV